MKKTIVGSIEKVVIGGKRFKARVDTGARRSSLDIKVAEQLGLGTILRKTLVRSASGYTLRPIITTSVKIQDRRIKATFNLIDRSELEFSVLIGRNILKKGFLVDVGK